MSNGLSTATDLLTERLREVETWIAAGQVRKAERALWAMVTEHSEMVEPRVHLATVLKSRGELGQALTLLEAAWRLKPDSGEIGVRLAAAQLEGHQPTEARRSLERALILDPWMGEAWLMLSVLREASGDARGALRASFEAVTRSQRQGEWVNQSTTPAALLPAVVRAIDRVRKGRRELLMESFAELREEHGEIALKRVAHALRVHLREAHDRPTDPRQRPKFLYFPGLPDSPYYDPYLQPWAARLRAAFPEMRAEALRVLEEDRRLPNFVASHLRVEDYVSGDAEAPSWEAFFFFRHGQRYDANHQRCPHTSRALDSIELCRIEDQAPEILFSVLKPRSHINAHHGVTNVRLVMHVPLVIPPDCALNLVDQGEHCWEEGRLVMFDDTYLHEAWNRSEQTRIVLLMDCWNPHLTAVERQATKRLIETITSLQMADAITRRANTGSVAGDS